MVTGVIVIDLVFTNKMMLFAYEIVNHNGTNYNKMQRKLLKLKR